MNHNKNASDPIHQQQQQQQQPYHHHPHHANAKCGDLAFGQPYVIVKNELVYQQDDEFMYGNDRWAYLKKRRLSSQLVKCFPLVYVLTHSIALIVNALIQIGLQIALMTTNGALWFIAAGIWAGVYFLITASFTLLLVYNRKYWTFMVAYFLHLFGILVAIGAYLVVNILAIAEYTPRCSYYPNCFNANVKVLNYIMFFLGVVCLIMLLLFAVLLPFWIIDYPNLRRNFDKEKKEITEREENGSRLKHSLAYIQNNLN